MMNIATFFSKCCHKEQQDCSNKKRTGRKKSSATSGIPWWVWLPVLSDLITHLYANNTLSLISFYTAKKDNLCMWYFIEMITRDQLTALVYIDPIPKGFDMSCWPLIAVWHFDANMGWMACHALSVYFVIYSVSQFWWRFFLGSLKGYPNGSLKDFSRTSQGYLKLSLFWCFSGI